MPESVQVKFTAPLELWGTFRVVCADVDQSAAQVLRQLMREYLRKYQQMDLLNSPQQKGIGLGKQNSPSPSGRGLG